MLVSSSRTKIYSVASTEEDDDEVYCAFSPSLDLYRYNFFRKIYIMFTIYRFKNVNSHICFMVLLVQFIG